MRILEGDSFNLLNFSRSIAVSSSGIICLLVTVIFVAEKLRPTNINTLPIFLNGEGNGNLLQYSCLENPLDRGTWQAIVHGVARVGHSWVTREREREISQSWFKAMWLSSGQWKCKWSCILCSLWHVRVSMLSSSLFSLISQILETVHWEWRTTK